MSMSNEIGILLYCYSFAHALVGLLVSRKGCGQILVGSQILKPLSQVASWSDLRR